MCCLITFLASRPAHLYFLLTTYLLLCAGSEFKCWAQAHPCYFPEFALHTGSSRSCRNLVTLACVCGPNLTSRDRNQEVNTKACGSWHSALRSLCCLWVSQLPGSEAEGAASMVESREPLSSPCSSTLEHMGISFWFLFIILSYDTIQLIEHRCLMVFGLPDNVLPFQNAWVSNTSPVKSGSLTIT